MIAPIFPAVVAKLGLWLALSLHLSTAVLTVIFRFRIAELYNGDPEVAALAGSLMLMAALYQLSDSVQVVAAGALRGYKDTAVPFYITLFSYWGIGMSFGYTLAYTDHIVSCHGRPWFLGRIDCRPHLGAAIFIRLRCPKHGVHLSLIDGDSVHH